MTKGNASFYLDTQLIETVLGETSMTKTAQAGVLSGLGDVVKQYFGSHFDPNDKEGSVVNMLAPAAISTLFRAFGFGKLGMLFGVAASALHLDVASMVRSIYDRIKESISRGHVTPSELDNAVSGAVQEHTVEMPPQETEGIGQQADQTQAFDKRNFDKELRDARIVRLSLEQYESQMMQLTKEAAPSRGWFSGAASRRATGSLIGRIIGWVFKMILMSAGFMVAGDVANKLLGRPNALDHTYQAGQPSSGGGGSSAPTSSSNPWIEHVTNSPDSIETMLLGFAKEVYPNLVGKEDAIKQSPAFQGIKEQIVWYNRHSPGDNFIYIPMMFSDKKSLVDRFANGVAKNA